LIEKGDAEAVALTVRRHLEGSVFYASGEGDTLVSAASIR